MTKRNLVSLIVVVSVMVFGSWVMLQRLIPSGVRLVSDEKQPPAAISTDGTIYVDKKGGWEMKIPSDWYPDDQTNNSSGPGARFCHSRATQPSPNCLDYITVTPYTPVAAQHGHVAFGLSYESMRGEYEKWIASYPKMELHEKDDLITGARVLRIKHYPVFDKALDSENTKYDLFYPNAYIFVEMSDDEFEPILKSLRLNESDGA